jgi:dipeptidyl aminopeptidase/acylaminoacyl peptidase
MKVVSMLLAVVIAIGLLAAVALGAPPELIPRKILFGNPERSSPQLSPDGKMLAYLAPDEGVMNVWVRTVGQNDDRVVTQDRKRGIRGYGWSWDSAFLFYIQDKDGDENWHLYRVDWRTKGSEAKDMTPFPGVQAQMIKASKQMPDKLLVGLNKDNPRAHDVYMLNVKTGELTLDTKNPGNIVGWDADDQLRVLGALVMNPDGGATIKVRDNPQAEWRDLLTHGPEDSANITDFAPDGKSVYLLHNIGTDLTCLYQRDLATGKDTLIFKPEKADVGGVFADQDTHRPLAVNVDYLRSEWHVLDDSIRADFADLAKVRRGDFFIASRDRDDKTWLVGYDTDNGPVCYYSYDRAAKKATFLFTNQPALEKLHLATMKPVVIKSRDGLDLVSYLTLPVDTEPKNLPMVLFVHGGPWGRDSWGYNPYPQWLSNRGYAVLQVNFRASAGFGKAFLNAGNHQWGAKMQDDLTDAVRWAVKEGIADKAKVAIMGGSYGGYATLAGAAFTPDVYCCGVDIVGPSNIDTLIKSVPPYWTPLLNLFRVRIGDWDKDPEYIKSISPLFKADQIKIPLLIGQGKNDPRVNVKESLQIVEAIKKNGKPVTYIEFPDEGHGFARPENRMAFNAATEKFLAEYLGGRVEPPSAEEKALLEQVTKD